MKLRRVARITKNLLHLLEQNAGISQRHLSEELGIALGATNAYMQKCITQGWIQKQGSRTGRGYHITPKGRVQKSKLHLRCLRNDLSHYQGLKAEMYQLLKQHHHVYVCGTGALADMAAVCALELDGDLSRITAFIGEHSGTYMGKPMIEKRSIDSDTPLLVTCLKSPQEIYKNMQDIGINSVILLPSPLKEIMDHQ